MVGLRKAILNNLPESWEVILRREKILSTFIERLYQNIPSYYKGRYGFKHGIERAKWMMNNLPIHQCINHHVVNEDVINWYEINRKIKEYENNCK